MSALREEAVRFADARVPGCFEAGCLRGGHTFAMGDRRGRRQLPSGRPDACGYSEVVIAPSRR